MGFACGVEHNAAWDKPQDLHRNISHELARKLNPVAGQVRIRKGCGRHTYGRGAFIRLLTLGYLV